MTMTGREKAAAILLSLDTPTAAEVMANLTQSEIEAVIGQMCKMGPIDAENVDAVIEEFSNSLGTSIPVGGSLEAVGQLLEQVMGPRGREMLNQMMEQMEAERHAKRGLEAVKDLGVQELLSLVQNEHPQMVALIMSHIEPERSASLLTQLPEEQQVDVVTRMARAESTSRETLRQINLVLEGRARTFGSLERDTPEARYKSVAEILNMVGRSTERAVLDGISQEDPEMAEEIKNLMFVFEDLVIIDDRPLQKVLSQIDTKTLAMSLKTASQPVKEKLFGNISKRAQQTIREELELLGPRRVSEVEEAQQTILETIKRLHEDGEITISRGRGVGEQLV